jgi:predicted DNA-binding transcriptional regulator YafY
MSRVMRLLDLMQALRRRRRPVKGATLAQELGISLRTLYRDIAPLQAQGAAIEGEAGVGYVLKPGFTLPPLMFSIEEVEALALGAQWVASRADDALSRRAGDALAKIAAVLPEERSDFIAWPTLIAAPGKAPDIGEPHLPLLRQALREERKLALRYIDATGRPTERVVWPVALGFFESARVLAAWCETRGAFRHFRADRIAGAAILDAHPPRRRRILLKEWTTEEGIED